MATIRQRPNGKWQVQVKYPDGTTRSATKPTKAIAAAWAREKESERSNGQGTSERNDTVTVGDLYELWLPLVRSEGLAPNTLARHEGQWRCRVQARWADVPVRQIRRSHVRLWVAQMGRDGEGKATQEAALRLLSNVLNVARADDVIPFNPAHGVQVGYAPAEKVILTREEMARMIEAADEHHRLLFELLSSTGLRIGEALALRGVDLDPVNHLVSVRQARTRYGFKEPKTKAGIRDVPLTPALSARLAGLRVIGQGRLFSGDDRGLAKALHRACSRADVPVVTLHSLRHYATTQLLDAGLPTFHVARVLGHRDTRMIDKTYGHVTTDGLELVRLAMGARA